MSLLCKFLLLQQGHYQVIIVMSILRGHTRLHLECFDCQKGAETNCPVLSVPMLTHNKAPKSLKVRVQVIVFLIKCGELRLVYHYSYITSVRCGVSTCHCFNLQLYSCQFNLHSHFLLHTFSLAGVFTFLLLRLLFACLTFLMLGILFQFTFLPLRLLSPYTFLILCLLFPCSFLTHHFGFFTVMSLLFFCNHLRLFNKCY